MTSTTTEHPVAALAPDVLDTDVLVVGITFRGDTLQQGNP